MGDLEGHGTVAWAESMGQQDVVAGAVPHGPVGQDGARLLHSGPCIGP